VEDKPIPPSRKALAEARDLSVEILKNLELSETSLTNIALKASRVARLLNEFAAQQIFIYEASGYPTDDDGTVPSDAWELGVIAGRKYTERDAKSGETKEFIHLESIAKLESQIKLTEAALAAAVDPDVSISSANPMQVVSPGIGNTFERQGIVSGHARMSAILAKSRAFIHDYVSRKHYELEFSGIADDVFSRTRERVDAMIGATVPAAVQKLTAVYEGLQSENPEDWSNAVHSCRRVLEDLADALFPATDEVRHQNGKLIKLGKEKYINRLIAFVEERRKSKRFSELVGSHLDFLGDRLDAVFKAAQKGSHAMVEREEADRYVVYTYLIVGDLLSLLG
jgi:AbiTii